MSNGVDHRCVPCRARRNDDQTYVQEILHHKCYVIELVKEQMINADRKFNEQHVAGTRKNAVGGYLWCKRFLILRIILLLLLLWLSLMFGAYLGATLCGPSPVKQCGWCGFELVPRLMSTPAANNIGGVY